MGSLQRAIRRAGQAVLCASALTGGAALSHYTHSQRPAVNVGVFPEPMPAFAARIGPREPPEEVALRLRGAPPVSSPRTPEEHVLDEADVREPLGPFAEPLRDGRVMFGRTPHRLILFTFDDGPDARNTPRLLDHLDAVGVKGVFFLTASRMAGRGPWAETNQEIARDILRRGHIVGNHTLDHVQLPTVDTAGVIAQVRDADAIFERVLGARTWLVRPPGGGRSPRVDGILASRGYTQVLWNLGTGDFQVRSADDVVRTFRRVLERNERMGERGGIVLMHDTHAWSVDAFPRMVSWIRERNCELAREGEELYDIVDDPALFFAAREGASPTDEAPLATLPEDVLEARQARVRDATEARCSRLARR